MSDKKININVDLSWLGKLLKFYILPFGILNLLLYIVCGFVAASADPGNWLLFTTIIGRICVVVIEIVFFVFIMEANED